MYQLCHFCLHFCTHAWAPISTLAYYSKGFPHWWHQGYTPMTSLRVGISSPTVVGIGTNSNTPLFIWFNPYSETFFSFVIHASIFLLVGQVNLNYFRTIVAITFNNTYRSAFYKYIYIPLYSNPIIKYASINCIVNVMKEREIDALGKCQGGPSLVSM